MGEWQRQREADKERNGNSNNISDSTQAAHVKYSAHKVKWNEWVNEQMYETGKTVNRPSMTKYLNFIQPVCCNAHNIHRAYYMCACVLVTWWCAMVLNYLIFSWCFHFILFPSLFKLNTIFPRSAWTRSGKRKNEDDDNDNDCDDKKRTSDDFFWVVAIEFIYIVHLCICWMCSI